MTRWQRTLLVTAIGQTFSIVGFSFVTPFLPLFIEKLGVHGVAHVTLWAGLLAGGTALCMAISAPIWGVLADRHGRKIMVVRASFSAALLIGIMGLSQNVYQLLALRMLQGMFTGTVTASQALVASQTPKDRMGFSLGVMQTSVFLGNSVGPLLGGIVADAFGFRQSFVFAGVVLLLSGILITVFVQEEKPETPAPGAARTGFFAGLGEAARTPGVMPMVVVIFAVQFGVTVVFPILPQFVQMLEGPGGHTATVTGLIFTGAGIAGALSSLAAGWFADQLGFKRVIMIALGVTAVLSLPQALVTHAWQLLVLRIGIGLAMGAVMPSASALISILVPAEQRGTAYGLMGSATSIGFGAGPLAAAGMVAVSGIRSVFVMSAVMFAMIAAWVALAMRVPTAAGEESPTGVHMERASG
jgi:DHA1 family multidrug resistance protein-like MFS transporter